MDFHWSPPRPALSCPQRWRGRLGYPRPAYSMQTLRSFRRYLVAVALDFSRSNPILDFTEIRSVLLPSPHFSWIKSEKFRTYFKISFFARDNAKTNMSYLTLFFLHSSSQSGNTMLIWSTPSSADKRHIYNPSIYISQTRLLYSESLNIFCFYY